MHKVGIIIKFFIVVMSWWILRKGIPNTGKLVSQVVVNQTDVLRMKGYFIMTRSLSLLTEWINTKDAGT